MKSPTKSKLIFSTITFIAFWTWLIKAELSAWNVEVTYLKSFVFSIFAQIVLIFIAVLDTRIFKIFQFIMIFTMFFCLGHLIWRHF